MLFMLDAKKRLERDLGSNRRLRGNVPFEATLPRLIRIPLYRMTDIGIAPSNLRASLPTPSTPSETMGDKPGFRHYSKAQSSFKPPLIANENAFLGDVFSRYLYHPHITMELAQVLC
jgi:hypothetical protein